MQIVRENTEEDKIGRFGWACVQTGKERGAVKDWAARAWEVHLVSKLLPKIWGLYVGYDPQFRPLALSLITPRRLPLHGMALQMILTAQGHAFVNCSRL